MTSPYDRPVPSLLLYYAAYGLVFFQITQPDHVCLKHALLILVAMIAPICTKIVIQCHFGTLKTRPLFYENIMHLEKNRI